MNADPHPSLRHIECTTERQAVVAAHAVNEARVIVMGLHASREALDEKLRALEMALYREGERLKRKRKVSR